MPLRRVKLEPVVLRLVGRALCRDTGGGCRKSEGDFARSTAGFSVLGPALVSERVGGIGILAVEVEDDEFSRSRSCPWPWSLAGGEGGSGPTYSAVNLTRWTSSFTASAFTVDAIEEVDDEMGVVIGAVRKDVEDEDTRLLATLWRCVATLVIVGGNELLFAFVYLPCGFLTKFRD